MINAYNDKETNTIHISYPIVHSPFYIDNEKNYLNYGAIGMIIAHELIHSYDSNNRYIFANEGSISWVNFFFYIFIYKIMLKTVIIIKILIYFNS